MNPNHPEAIEDGALLIIISKITAELSPEATLEEWEALDAEQQQHLHAAQHPIITDKIPE